MGQSKRTMEPVQFPVHNENFAGGTFRGYTENMDCQEKTQSPAQNENFAYGNFQSRDRQEKFVSKQLDQVSVCNEKKVYQQKMLENKFSKVICRQCGGVPTQVCYETARHRRQIQFFTEREEREIQLRTKN